MRDWQVICVKCPVTAPDAIPSVGLHVRVQYGPVRLQADLTQIELTHTRVDVIQKLVCRC